ncbi:NADH dehydrogenase [ubiquinone] 1 subunit C2 [Zophobas morio]|uniref:NADH dehydrogenase [ubiquinone] 1 subunit C2 n=1 Tax=Zophobas morio TaxID=2755281 RepID=UPI003083AC69
MATGPKVATSPLEVLRNDGTRAAPIWNKYWGPIICGGLGFLGVVAANWAIRRPLMSGIQTHVLVTAGGAAIGKYVDDYRNEYLAERDAVFRHYVDLHPEDFPEFARKKYSEVLEPWVPIR